MSVLTNLKRANFPSVSIFELLNMSLHDSMFFCGLAIIIIFYLQHRERGKIPGHRAQNSLGFSVPKLQKDATNPAIVGWRERLSEPGGHV